MKKKHVPRRGYIFFAKSSTVKDNGRVFWSGDAKIRKREITLDGRLTSYVGFKENIVAVNVKIYITFGRDFAEEL